MHARGRVTAEHWRRAAELLEQYAARDKHSGRVPSETLVALTVANAGRQRRTTAVAATITRDA